MSNLNNSTQDMDDIAGTAYNDFVSRDALRSAVKGATPTIRTVAALANVSVGTVSRVLNNHPNVHRATRERVLDAMSRLGYRPDPNARELSTGHRPTIGLMHARGNRKMVPFFLLFLERLTTTALDDGFRFKEVGIDQSGMPEEIPDALVLFGAHDADPRIAHLRNLKVPFVLIGRSTECACVAPDDRSGGRQAAEHLIALGHRRIAHVTGDFANQAPQDRRASFAQALADAGLDLPEDYVLDGKFSVLGGYRAMRRFIAQRKPFSAVFAAGDEMAAGVVAALEDDGLRVPQDVSVVGYDDLPEFGEDLTTVRQDIGELAAAAVGTLASLMKGGQEERLILPVQLIARGSSARAG